MWHKNIILFWPLAMSSFFIHHLTVGTFFTQYRKVRNQIDTFEMSGTKLTNVLKVRDQISSLPKIIYTLELKIGLDQPWTGPTVKWTYINPIHAQKLQSLKIDSSYSKLRPKTKKQNADKLT